MVAGETAPEGLTLPGESPTVGELLERLRTARTTKKRNLTLPFSYDVAGQSLREVGINDGDLIVVAAAGEPVPDQVADRPTLSAEPEAAAEPAGRRRRPRQAPEYEQLTRDLQWHAPYHVDGNARRSWEVWDQRNTVLRSQDWEAYRAPDKLYYRTYTARQAKADHAVSTAFEFAASDRSISRVDKEHVEQIRGFLGTLGFTDWGLCILHQHATRFALSSWLAGAAQFVMFDQLRHAQLYGRLNLAYGEAHEGFGDGRGREQWLDEPRFQPVRRLVEELLALLDWAQGMITADLVFEPVYTAVVHALLNERSVRSGDELTVFVTHSIANDKQRHRADASALLDMLVADPVHGQHNRALVQRWAQEWLPAVADALVAFTGDATEALPALDRAVGEVNEQLVAAGPDPVEVARRAESVLEAV
jgi:hypothetical protein